MANNSRPAGRSGRPAGRNPYLNERDRRSSASRGRSAGHGAPTVKSRVVPPRGRKRRKRRSGNTRFVVLTFLFILLIGAILTFTVFFNVDTVIIRGETRYTELQITSAGDINIGDNLFFTADKKSRETIMRSLPYIYDIQVERQFPSTLILTVSETPAFFTMAYNNEYVLLDGNMKVLEKTTKAADNVILIEGASLKQADVGQEAVFMPAETEAETEDQKSGEIESPRTLIDRVIAAIVSESFSGLTKIDISDRMNIQLIYQDRLTLIMGAPIELDYKLRFAAKSIEKLENDATGYINLSVPKNAFYSPNNSQVGEVMIDT